MTRRRSLDDVVRAQTRTPPPAAVTPKVFQLRDPDSWRGHSRTVEASHGKGDLRSGRKSRRGILAGCSEDRARRQATPPPAATAPAAAAAAAATARIQAGLGLLPSSCSISGQKGKPYSSLQQSTFSGAQNCAETSLLSRVSTSEPEPRLPSVVLPWDAAWRRRLCAGQVFFPGWHPVKTRGRGLLCESQDLWTWGVHQKKWLFL